MTSGMVRVSDVSQTSRDFCFVPIGDIDLTVTADPRRILSSQLTGEGFGSPPSSPPRPAHADARFLRIAALMSLRIDPNTGQMLFALDEQVTHLGHLNQYSEQVRAHGDSEPRSARVR